MITTLPRLTSQGIELDQSPQTFGELRRSDDAFNDVETLRARMNSDGYLFLPGYLNREEVLSARHEMLLRLAQEGVLDESAPLDEGRVKPNVNMQFRADLALENAELQQVLYNGAMMQFWAKFFGEEVRHFDFTWVRAVAPGHGTPPHCDVVYMGRGTQELYTAWTPLGDTTLKMGGLMMLENSHKHQKLRENYGRKDVDTYCTNKRGDDFREMGGGGNIRPGGWLSNQPHKLRERLGGRWLTNEFRAGDLLVFSVFTVHASLDNQSDKIRLSSDSRYQRASQPADERWIGANPIGHGPEGKRGMIC
jgi:hypothetical protein